MFQYGFPIAKNAYEAAIGSSSFIPFPSETHLLSVIPIGSKNGIMAFNNMVIAKNDALIMKDDMTATNIGVLRSNPAMTKKNNDHAGDLPKMLGLASGCCVCLPMHISKIRGNNYKAMENSKKEFEKYY